MPRPNCFAAAPLLSRAARIFAEEEIPMAERLRQSMVAVIAAMTVWDEERWHVIVARALQSCRDAGLLVPLVIYVNSMTIFKVWQGDFAEAASLVAEAEAIAAATGTLFPPVGAMMLTGFRGTESEAVPLIEAMSTAAQAAGPGPGCPVVAMGGRHHAQRARPLRDGPGRGASRRAV